MWLKVGGKYYPSTSITRQLVRYWEKVERCRLLVPNWTDEEFDKVIRKFGGDINELYNALSSGRLTKYCEFKEIQQPSHNDINNFYNSISSIIVDKKSPRTGGSGNRGDSHGKDQRTQS